jgi:hypothetical protein
MKRKLLALAGIAIFGIVLFSGTNDSVPVAFHQKFIETGEKQELKNSILDLNDIDTVFWHVFSNLEPEVIVYPTENYYYFVFKANGKEIWGNIRLAVEEREAGLLNFAYWEARSAADGGEAPISSYKQYGPKDGLAIEKFSDFKYAISYNGKKVIFNLNEIPQTHPKLFTLESGEVAVQRTLDESGFGFFLIFNKKEPHFMFVLDEERNVPDRLVNFNNELATGEKSRFAFYLDKKNQRKILMGVHTENIMRNNYYDGPFDQLADNYIKNDDFKKYLEATYPELTGQVDNYGKFIQYDDARVALTPYYPYSSTEWLYGIIKSCGESYVGNRFYACITYDQKEKWQK